MVPSRKERVQKRLASEIIETFKRSVGTGRQLGEDDRKVLNGRYFFKNWFTLDPKRCLFFLFKKNLKVTDIQFAELLALLRVHSHSGIFDSTEELQFLSTEEFYDTVEKIAEAFLADRGSRRDYLLIAKLHEAMFARTVVVKSRFGSCEVFLPPRLEVNLAPICASSGYIHSCGYNIFVRAAYKATEGAFLRALKQYLKTMGPDTKKKIYFAAYSHEDFDKYDLAEGRLFKNGLDDVKIGLEKFYMGGLRVVEIINKLGTKLGDSIEVAQAGDSGRRKKEDINQRAADRLDLNRTIWLIVDRASSEVDGLDSTAKWRAQSGKKPVTTYFVCFDQRYVNDNPFHIFDENKPAWEDHTTIPHTLMGAMINITRPWWPSNRKVVICDPFAGTGTFLFEAAKFRNVEARGYDRSRLARTLQNDNLAFFSATKDELENWRRALNQIEESSNTQFRNAIHGFKQSRTGVLHAPSLANPEVRKFTVDQLLYYLLVRAKRRYAAEFIRLQEAPQQEQLLWQAFRKEKDVLASQLGLLLETKNHPSLIDSTSKPSEIDFLFRRGTFAASCAADFKRPGKIETREIKQLPSDSYDVIVTDPPYGFNTKENVANLARLYHLMIKKMILGLRRRTGGQIVIALPDWSHTGRQLPLFALERSITRQVFLIARQYSRRITHIGRPGELFRPPYYWESESALRRAILHFRIGPARQANHPRT